MKRYLKLLALAVCAALALCACDSQPEAEQPPRLLEPVGVFVDTAVCRYSEIYSIHKLNASVTPYVEELYFPIDGQVGQVFVIPGQAVRQGDPLVELNLEAVEKQLEDLNESEAHARRVYAFQNEQAQLDIDMLSLSLQQARQQEAPDPAELEREERAVSDAELALRQARESQALELSIIAQQRAQLEKRLGQNTLYAPFDGRVAYLTDLQEGSYLPAYTPALYLADDSRLLLSGDYLSPAENRSASRLYALIRGQEFEISLVERATSDIIADILAGLTPTSQFTIDGPAQALDALKSGDYAAIIRLSSYVERALTLPSNAVFRDAGGSYVYVMNDDGTRTRASVITGVKNDSLVEIREGLEEGAVVYVQD